MTHDKMWQAKCVLHIDTQFMFTFKLQTKHQKKYTKQNNDEIYKI